MRDISLVQLLEELRALKPQFEREGVVHLSVFGSRARGDNRPDSDVDVIVDVKPGHKFGLEAVGVYNIIEDRLGLPSSIVTRPGLALDPQFHLRAAADEVPVF